MRILRNKFAWILAVVVAFSAAAFITSSVSALCPASCQHPASGRDFFKGYFTNRDVPINSPDPSTHGAFWRFWEAPWTVDNADEYVNFIRNSLNDTSNGSVNDHTAAASYVITAQLGYKGADFGGSVLNGVNTSRSRFGDWERLVREYDRAGLINWNGTIRECSGDIQANLDYIIHDTYYFQTSFPGGCYNDPAIIFLHPVTRAPIFQLKKSCGNPVGDNLPLPPVTPPPYGTVNPPTPGNPSTTPPTPSGYNTGNTATHSSCAFTTGTARDPSDPGYRVPVTVTYSGGGTGTSTGTSDTTSPYAYVIATPQSVKDSISTVTATVVGRARDGTNFNIGTITFGPCLLANPSCPTPTVTPSSIDPQTRFTVFTAVNYATPLQAQIARAQPGFRYFITISGPGFSYSQDVPASGPSGGVTISGNTGLIGPTNNTGTYAIGWGIVSSFGAINCGAAIPANPNPPTFPVSNKPYFKVNGGDISAGAGMSTGGQECASGGVAPNPDASIVSWNRGSAGAYGGAGTQFGALALNHLMGFASGQGSGLAPSRLSFGNTGAANQVNEAQELYGGKFGSTACTADYFANATGVINDNAYVLSGRTIANGTRQTIYVDGNVHITGNIVFAGATAGYPNAAAIPSFSVIVRGNIYIAPGVTQLDGFYVAQPDNGTATNGIIYSCAPSGFSTTAANVLTANLQNNCPQALTVNGAFAARQVWLLRTAGTVSGNTAAETFNYSPDVWLSAPFGNGLSPVTTNEYDSITSLPPVL